MTITELSNQYINACKLWNSIKRGKKWRDISKKDLSIDKEVIRISNQITKKLSRLHNNESEKIINQLRERLTFTNPF